ncbi:DUF6503 family protein [Nonlabens sp.]|uniref:DUF6503 family protein n=1 Tax=Nonlabens sp. TaxID=1888209 RepID=UPI001BCB97A8|nr:DUF6503 family protein [Nonlabens sp.]
MNYLFTLLLLCTTCNTHSQELSGKELLEKAIKAHDPYNNWPSFNESIQITMTAPKSPKRVSDVTINLLAQTFKLIAVRDSVMTKYRVNVNEISVVKADWKNPKKKLETAEKDLERAVFMKNYYTYLYGLPMKLKDQGTHIAEKVERKSFIGKEYLVLKATYDQHVGSDAWFFYFDPTTYQMEVYQFFKTDPSGKILPDTGEYILLSETHRVNDIYMPKVRKWYGNKEDQFLGTDEITK